MCINVNGCEFFYIEYIFLAEKKNRIKNKNE